MCKRQTYMYLPTHCSVVDTKDSGSDLRVIHIGSKEQDHPLMHTLDGS